jgi:acetoin:2,6-dichlorophenolindophenol oxidoreductase subunit alpha
VLYVCENNQWQAFVPRAQTMAVTDVADWARGHGLAELRVVDGNDVEAVQAAAREMTEAMRADGRPRLLELTTYRLRGHFEPDDQAYVPADELAAWRARDPIARFEQRLQAEGVLGSGELAALRSRVAASVQAALAFAQASPWPDASSLTTDVYA